MISCATTFLCTIRNDDTQWYHLLSVAYRGGVGVFKPPPPKFQSFDKVEPDCKLSGKCLVFRISLKIAELRTPTPQDIRKKMQ